MSIIIPYLSELGPQKGAIIRPDGEFLYIKDNKHEEFAQMYLTDQDYTKITGANYGAPYSTAKYLEAVKDIKDFQNGKDIFMKSNLTKLQLERYKKWLERSKTTLSYCDFLVLVLAYDKVETAVRNVITTTAAEPHVRFFNYYLMDWEIIQQDRLFYHSEDDTFKPVQNDLLVSDHDDREAEEELKEIKANVLIKDRSYFFK